MTATTLDNWLRTLLDVQDIDTAVQELAAGGYSNAETIEKLTGLALENAETDPRASSYWLTVAQALFNQGQFGPSLQAQIIYTQARVSLVHGELKAAEEQIMAAQALWREDGGGIALDRSYLGLTQVLALQGRYAEAETAIRAAIAGLPQESVPASQARLNWANLLRRQERHQEALAQYESARHILTRHLANTTDPSAAESFQTRLAHVALNQANALMFLDRPSEAETALHNALEWFTQVDDPLNLGRTHTNLGSLYLRMGRYNEALQALQAAGSALARAQSGMAENGQESTEPAQSSDILHLEQARAYLALNLIPEAISELETAIELFDGAGKPFELGQSLYTLGMVRLNGNELSIARRNLHAARQIFDELDNSFWQNRIQLALASVDYRDGDLTSSRKRIDDLMERYTSPFSQRDTHQQNGSTGAAERLGERAHRAHGWDVGLAVEMFLLRLRLHLENGLTENARIDATRIHEIFLAEGQIGDGNNGDHAGGQGIYPHLWLRYVQSLGCIAYAAGLLDEAATQFREAARLLETQRVQLPLEEFKTAFLNDKSDVYQDLIQCLLAHGCEASDGTDPSLLEAFAVSEQARSRSLLERLYALNGSPDPAAGEDEDTRKLRQQVHWFYNQLLSGDKSPLQKEQRRELRRSETALRQREKGYRESTSLAVTTDLAQFQRSLAPRQQALVYFCGPGTAQGSSRASELFAFVVSRSSCRLVRNLTTLPALQDAAALLRFQMGRVELGAGHLHRHRSHLIDGLNHALEQVYDLLIRPLEGLLDAEKLLIIPHGPLHQLPLHCLWNGDQYLLERFEISYMPSASLAVQCSDRDRSVQMLSWAGLALDDPQLTHTRTEVLRSASHFPNAHCFLGTEAGRAGLQQAAGSADILHLATHGLFRPDNPFYSSLKLADGWINVREIYRMKIRARLVVLSACESGAGHIQGGDEVVGLTRGFLGAGARYLLVSLWNVHDDSAVQFSDDFYTHLLKTGSPAQALHQTQQAWIDRKIHPYFWAPFRLIG